MVSHVSEETTERQGCLWAALASPLLSGGTKVSAERLMSQDTQPRAPFWISPGSWPAPDPHSDLGPQPPWFFPGFSLPCGLCECFVLLPHRPHFQGRRPDQADQIRASPWPPGIGLQGPPRTVHTAWCFPVRGLICSWPVGLPRGQLWANGG